MLERHVFNVFAAYEGVGEELLFLVRTADVVRRTNTGVGFYTDFTVDRSHPPLLLRHRVICTSATTNVLAQSKVLPMVFNLFFDESGYPEQLEGVHFGFIVVSGGWVEESVNLREGDLAALLPLPDGDPPEERQ